MPDDVIYKAEIVGSSAPFVWRLHRGGGCPSRIVPDPANPAVPLEGFALTYEQALRDARGAAAADYEEWVRVQARKVEIVFRAPAITPDGHDELLPGLPVREPVRELDEEDA